MRRVVITGMGAVTPIGNNVSDTWKSVKAGKCGIDKITHYDVTNRKVKVAGEVKNLNFEDYIDIVREEIVEPVTNVIEEL